MLVERDGLASTAKRFKKPDRQINDMLAGRKSFGEKVAREMEANYDASMPAGWLDDPKFTRQEHGSSTTEARHPDRLIPVTTWEHPDELPAGEFVHVPRLNVHPSAGNGNGEQIEVDLERSQTQAFRADWIRRERLRPGKLASMYADGHSMEPLIQDGDSLLVDTSQTTVIDGKVYVIWYAGELRVKRLYKRVDGGLVIHSDNVREFPPLEVPIADLEHVRIIGRVVHRQGTGGL